tara:strand:- start:157 stop:1086 length:930 start_codon:yes stop_codon:yes gene_type:complete
MRNISIIFISLFLNFLKRLHPINENLICFLYKSLIIVTLFTKDNLLVNKQSPEILNKFFIPYYIYSIFNHLHLNYLDFYMILHHLCALNFLHRDKYSNNSVNLLHGNLVLADYPNVISELYHTYTGKSRSINNEFYCDSFFIVYKILFGIFNSFLYSSYCLNKETNIRIKSRIFAEGVKGSDYEWDSMSNFTMAIMYIAIIFKINKINSIRKDLGLMSKMYKGICILSFFVISRNLLMAGNNGKLIKTSLLEQYSFTFSKMSIINIVVYYYKVMLKSNLLNKQITCKNLYINNKKDHLNNDIFKISFNQ